MSAVGKAVGNQVILAVREEVFQNVQGQPVCVLGLSGVIDLGTAEFLRSRAIGALRRRHFTAVVLDLTRITALDASSLALLRALRRESHLEALGKLVVAASPNSQSRRMLGISKLDVVIPVSGTAGEALQVASTFR